MKKVAVVTGANRGLGFEICRQLAEKEYQVVLTSRDESKGKESVDKLHQQGLTNVLPHQLDVTNPESIECLISFIANKFNRIDVLINNAGVYLDSKRPPENTIFNLQLETLQKTLETNLYGSLLLCQGLAPLMVERSYGRIVNVSSIAGQLSTMTGRHPAYRISKVAVNTLTRILADELRETHVVVNAVCPGWVKTDLGGANAVRDLAEGADTIVWLATMSKEAPTGLFFRDRQPIDW